LKQIFEGGYGRHLRGHACQQNTVFSSTETGKQDDTHFYTYEEGKYKFYEVKRTLMSGNIEGTIITTRPPEDLSGVGQLDFSKVGVMENTGRHFKVTEFERSQIAGKAILAGKYICSIPKDVAEESY
jgi:hypothetical protein